MVLEKLENIDNNISEFKSQINENKNDIVKSYADVTKNLSEKITVNPCEPLNNTSKPTKLLVQEIINEYENENRVLNLITYGCSESSDDKSSFINVVKDGCGVDINEHDITNTRRLGAKQGNDNSKPRPLLVSLKNIETKRLILRNVYNLKTKLPGVYINVDRNKEERELFKEIRTKQKELIESDTEKQWFFRIVGPTWNPQIKKVQYRKEVIPTGSD